MYEGSEGESVCGGTLFASASLPLADLSARHHHPPLLRIPLHWPTAALNALGASATTVRPLQLFFSPSATALIVGSLGWLREAGRLASSSPLAALLLKMKNIFGLEANEVVGDNYSHPL